MCFKTPLIPLKCVYVFTNRFHWGDVCVMWATTTGGGVADSTSCISFLGRVSPSNGAVYTIAYEHTAAQSPSILSRITHLVEIHQHNCSGDIQLRRHGELWARFIASMSDIFRAFPPGSLFFIVALFWAAAIFNRRHHRRPVFPSPSSDAQKRLQKTYNVHHTHTRFTDKSRNSQSVVTPKTRMWRGGLVLGGAS